MRKGNMVAEVTALWRESLPGRLFILLQDMLLMGEYIHQTWR